MGKEAAAEVEKDHTIVQDPDLNTRLRSIGDALASVANALEVEAAYGSSTIVPFTYTFKVVEGDDVNAFSVPGGHVYIYEGLIDFCESDHELAAVIAHEIAHAAHHHMVFLLREQARLDGRMALILVAGLLGNLKSMDMSNVMLGTQFYRIAKINGYGQQAERDADLAAIQYMLQTSYNPVGMLTFLERLADHPDLVDWGILQTHPRAGDRAKAVRERLVDLGVEIDRRAVTTSFTAKVREVDCDNASAFEVFVGGRTICKLADQARAERIAERLNELFDADLQLREIKARGTNVLARGEVLIEVTEEDAALAGKPAAEVAAQASQAIFRVLFKQMVADMW